MFFKYPIICSHVYCYSNHSLTPRDIFDSILNLNTMRELLYMDKVGMYGNMVQNAIDQANNSYIQRFSHLDTFTTCITILIATCTRFFDTIVDANQIDSHTFTQAIYRFHTSFDVGCFKEFDAIWWCSQLHCLWEHFC